MPLSSIGLVCLSTMIIPLGADMRQGNTFLDTDRTEWTEDTLILRMGDVMMVFPAAEDGGSKPGHGLHGLDG